MARKYVNPSRALPDSPENLADYFHRMYAVRTGHLLDEVDPREVFRFYAAEAMRRDPGLAEQLREQLGVTGGKRGLPGLSVVQALYNRAAPGARAYGEHEFGVGEFFKAAWHGSRKDSAARRRLDDIRASFSTEVGADGGYLLPEEVRSELVLASLSLGAIRQRARVFPASTMRTKLPVLDDVTHSGSVFGVTATWTEVGAQIAESTAAFALAVLDSKGLKGLFNTPNELVNDAPAFDVFIREAVPEAWAYYEDLAYLTGTGVGEPAGMVSCAGSVAVAKEAGQASASLLWENVLHMAARLLPTSWPRAIWVACPDALSELSSMALAVGTAGGPVWSATGGLTLFGRPVYFYDFMPALGTTGDLMLVDPAYYGIADRMALQVDSSPHLKFNQDITTWRPVSRQDGRPLLQAALTQRNGASNTLSAYIQLAAR
jgi:HK97 family phage major capsid protein